MESSAPVGVFVNSLSCIRFTFKLLSTSCFSSFSLCCIPFFFFLPSLIFLQIFIILCPGYFSVSLLVFVPFFPNFSILPFTWLLKTKQKTSNRRRYISQLLCLCHSTNKKFKGLQNQICFPPMEVCYQHVELFLIVVLCAFLAGSM